MKKVELMQIAADCGANDSYAVQILNEFLEGKTLTANGDKYGNNSNQYFDNIKNAGIVLIEWWEPNRKNRGRHKERKLLQTPENIKATLALLAKLTKKTAPKP